MNDRVKDWAPDAVLGLAVLVVGMVEVWGVTVPYGQSRLTYVVVAVAFAVASGLSRQAPFIALLLVWVFCSVQLVAGIPVLSVEFSVAVVAFGCARWGEPATVVLSGLSIPAAGVVGFVIQSRAMVGVFRDLSAFGELQSSASRFSDTLQVGATILGLLVLVVPWLAGLALRATARARQSEFRQEEAEADAVRAQRETEQAREIARLREEQATMARDVHDVVGHSLAVILAQAESGQYLPDDDPEKLKRTMATIAGSARSSLQDVRQVLSGPAEPAPARSDAFEALVAGVRASGHEVRSTEVGPPQPLPPELDVAAHRVVQEMLTNAIKHGCRDEPVRVERHWDSDLRIEVQNAVGGPDPARPMDETQPVAGIPMPRPDGGQGLDGMRRRLEAVGGRLDTRRRTDPATYTATAWVPVRVYP
jgi:signal transduction histidine kinase